MVINFISPRLIRMGQHGSVGMGVVAMIAALVASFLLGKADLPSLYPVGHLFSDEGYHFFLVIGYLLLLITAWRGKDGSSAFLAIAVLVGVTVMVHGLKATLGHWMPRPSGSEGGFPSGHAAASFALAFLLSRTFPRAAALWYAIAAMIAWSRIETHAHWLYQVGAGAPLGLSMAVVFEWYQRKRRCLLLDNHRSSNRLPPLPGEG